MKLIGLMLARNEDWVIGLSARVALLWCDALVICCHACTDRTVEIAEEIAEEHPNRVVLMFEHVPHWDEMGQRQAMLEQARVYGATHIAIIDADEIVTGSLVTSYDATRHTKLEGMLIRAAVEDLPADSILQLPGYNLRTGITRYHDNGIWGKRWFSTALKYNRRLSWSGDKFHSREPGGMQLQPYRPIQQGQGGIMHLWGASERRLKAKHAHYKLTERLRWPNKSIQAIDRMYSWAIYGDITEEGSPYGTPATWTYADVPAEWWAPYAQWMRYLHVDAEPWQERACSDIIKEHGPVMFKGLDLFGVVS